MATFHADISESDWMNDSKRSHYYTTRSLPLNQRGLFSGPRMRVKHRESEKVSNNLPRSHRSPPHQSG